MQRRLSVLLVLVLAMALIIPSAALGFNWVKSPTSPLIVGGIHSQARFKDLFLHSTRVHKAVKMVMAADGTPAWVYGAAIAQAKAGAIHSAQLPIGTKIGAMGFGPGTIHVIGNTIWKGSFKLPYYYVVASKSVTQGAFLITTSYRVCLAKTCGNPFIFAKHVTRKQIKFNLFVEKRLNASDGPLLASWEITGTVGPKTYDVTTNSSSSTLIGSFAEGTPYSLSEALQEGWTIVSPQGGSFTGTMPAHDLTLTFVNRQNTID